jgi:hypothetical protein
MTQLFDLWGNLPARHAMLVHLPVVFGLLGVVPLLALAAGRFQSKSLRWVCLIWFVALSAGAGLASMSGEEAEEAIEDQIAMTAQAEHDLEEHEGLGENGWIWPLIPAVFISLTFVSKPKVRLPAGALAIAGSIGVAVWIALTAHAGGRLVHVHGLTGAGIAPGTSGSAQTPARTERDDDDDD